MKCFVVGNGVSLTPDLLDAIDCPSFGVNRIWRIFPRTAWRPTHYVRAEVPAYLEDDVREDLRQMAQVGCAMYLQDGFRGLLPRRADPATRYEFFKTCDGTQAHDWHLPEICGYGTVVHVAMQIAANLGFDEVELLGCDMTERHFYDGELFTNGDLARVAHDIARRCSPARLVYAK